MDGPSREEAMRQNRRTLEHSNLTPLERDAIGPLDRPGYFTVKARSTFAGLTLHVDGTLDEVRYAYSAYRVVVDGIRRRLNR